MIAQSHLHVLGFQTSGSEQNLTESQTHRHWRGSQVSGAAQVACLGQLHAHLSTLSTWFPGQLVSWQSHWHFCAFQTKFPVQTLVAGQTHLQVFGSQAKLRGHV